MNYRSQTLLGVFVAASSLFMAGCVNEPAYEPVYEVTLSIESNGEVISAPHVVLDRTSQAELFLRSTDSASRDLRLILAVPSELTHEGASAANVQLSLQHNDGASWATISDAEMTVPLGSIASTEFHDTDVHYKISVTVGRTANNNDAPTSDGYGSAAELRPPSDVDALAAGDGACCKVRCNLYTLTCCNVISCCDSVCNRCCNPQ